MAQEGDLHLFFAKSGLFCFFLISLSLIGGLKKNAVNFFPKSFYLAFSTSLEHSFNSFQLCSFSMWYNSYQNIICCPCGIPKAVDAATLV